MIKRYDGKVSYMADGGYVSYADYETLQQKLDAMTADNFGLSSAAYTLLQMLNEPEGLSDAIARMEKALENPATDAQVNALRAEGVDMLAKQCDGYAANHVYSYTKRHAEDFAAQLRNCDHAAKDGGDAQS